MIAQQAINGLMLGSIYVLVAVAFTLAIGILNFLNFSIPGTFMVGGMGAWWIVTAGWHWSLAVTLPLLAAALISYGVYRLSYRPSEGGDPELPLVSSLGFLVLMENLAIIGLGSDQQAFPSFIGDFNLRFGPLVIGAAQMICLAVSLGTVVGLYTFLRFSNAGRRIRAIAEDRGTALLLGVDVAGIVPRLFAFSAVFSALGGILFAVGYLQVSPFMGEVVGFKGVSAMIVGGMGSVWGAVAGGLLIGMAEVFSIQILGSDFVNLSVYGLLLLILLVRPEGLLGRPAAREKL